MQPMGNYDAMKNFYAMCAAALRLAKAMNEGYGLEEHHD